MVRPDGYAKVLDFGIAKLVRVLHRGASATRSPDGARRAARDGRLHGARTDPRTPGRSPRRHLELRRRAARDAHRPRPVFRTDDGDVIAAVLERAPAYAPRERRESPARDRTDRREDAGEGPRQSLPSDEGTADRPASRASATRCTAPVAPQRSSAMPDPGDRGRSRPRINGRLARVQGFTGIAATRPPTREILPPPPGVHARPQVFVDRRAPARTAALRRGGGVDRGKHVRQGLEIQFDSPATRRATFT